MREYRDPYWILCGAPLLFSLLSALVVLIAGCWDYKADKKTGHLSQEETTVVQLKKNVNVNVASRKYSSFFTDAVSR